MRGSVRLGVSEHGQGPNGQPHAQVAVPCLDAGEPVLASDGKLPPESNAVN